MHKLQNSVRPSSAPAEVQHFPESMPEGSTQPRVNFKACKSGLQPLLQTHIFQPAAQDD